MKLDIKERKILLVVGVILLLLGAVLVKDYGLGYDENVEVDIARFNLKEYARFLCGEDSKIFQYMDARIGDLMDSVEIDHGEALIYPAIALVSVARALGHANVGMYILHYYLWIWFCVALLCLYFTGKILTGKKRWGVIAAAMLLLHPRFFSESFFNNKDVLMLSITAVCLYLGIRFVEEKNWKWSVLWGISVGFCVNLRIIGALYAVAFGFLYLSEYISSKERNWRQFKNGILAILAMFLTFVAITPATWYGLGHYIVYTLTNATGFTRWNSWVLYNGELYNYIANPLPWHYLIVFIAITTPIGILLSIVAGQLFYPVHFMKCIKSKENTRCWTKYLLIFSVIIWIPMGFFILKGGNVYNGWRHFYFIYPALILSAVLVLSEIEKLKNGRWLWGLIGIQGIVCLLIIITGHPLQFTYYNLLAGNHVEENYELDIWNVSFVHALTVLLEQDHTDHMLISSDEWNSYYGIKMAWEVLPEEKKKRIEIAEPETDACEEADYHLYSCTYINYQNKRIKAGIDALDFYKPEEKYNKQFEIVRYGRPVIEVYSVTE